MAKAFHELTHAGHGSQNTPPEMARDSEQHLVIAFKTASEDVKLSKESPKNPMIDPNVFPEGGRQAWLTVAGTSACLFVSFGWVNCAGIFQEYYESNQLKQYSPSEIAWIPALQSK